MLPVLEDIGSEIRLSFDYHENQHEQEVKEVYISGGSVLFPGIDTMLQQIFNLPIKVWDPLEGMRIQRAASPRPWRARIRTWPSRWAWPAGCEACSTAVRNKR